MSFPSNPTNGQQAIVNGIKYNYSIATNSWRRDFNNVLDRLFLVGNNQATSTSTGDLVVYGGAGFGKNVYIGGNLQVNGATNFIGTITGIISTATSTVNLQGGSQGSLVYQSGISTTAFIPIATTGSILMSNGVIPIWTTTAAITAAYAGTATNIAGGGAYHIPYQAAVGKTSFDPDFTFDGGTLKINHATASTGTSNGALVVTGGVGIGGNVFIGGNLQINGTTTYVNSTNLDVTDKNITIAKGAINAAAADGAGITVEGPATSPTILYSGSDDSWNLNKLLKGTTANFGGGVQSVSTISGTVTITNGGLGVGGNIYASAVYAPLTGTIGSGTRNTGAFTTVNANANIGSNSISTGTLVVTGGAGISGSLYVGATVNATNVVVTSTQTSIGVASGALVVNGGIGVARDIFLGGIMYGTASNSYYSNTATLALLATSATNIATGLITQIPYQSGTGQTTFSSNLTFDGSTLRTPKLVAVTSSTSVLPDAYFGLELRNTGLNQSPAIRLAGSTGGIVMVSSFGTLRIIQDATTLTNTLLSVGLTSVGIPIVTSSINTGTGSLVVGGGIGVGGDMYVGGTISASAVVNQFTTYTSSTNIITHNFLDGSVFYHSSITSNFTAAFVNVPTTNNRSFDINLILIQGSTGYYANGITINGTVTPIKWNGTQVPSANNINVERLTFIKTAAGFTVLGQLISYI